MHKALLITQLHSLLQGVLGDCQGVFNLIFETCARLADQMTMEVKQICGGRITAGAWMLLLRSGR